MPWILALALPLFIVGNFWLKYKQHFFEFVPVEVVQNSLPLIANIEDGVLSASQTAIESSPLAAPTPTVSPEMSPATIDPTKTVTMANPTSQLETDWIYPGATVISRDDGLKLATADPVGTVTDWYSAKLRGNYSSIAISKSTANGTVSNLLSASGGKHISIAITKKDNQAEIFIAVDFD